MCLFLHRVILFNNDHDLCHEQLLNPSLVLIFKVPEEEHNGAGVVQFIHFVEVRNLGDIDQIDGAEVLAFLRDAVQRLVHLHAGGVPVVAEPDQHHAVLLRQNGLVHLPPVGQML